MTTIEKLKSNQIDNIDITYKLYDNDINRLCKNIIGDIFTSSDNCCKWTGYVYKNKRKNSRNYVRFSVNGKKMLLHRILYSNFCGTINKGERIYFTCENKEGTCCSLQHLKIKNKKNNTNTKHDLVSIQHSVVISFD